MESHIKLRRYVTLASDDISCSLQGSRLITVVLCQRVKFHVSYIYDDDGTNNILM